MKKLLISVIPLLFLFGCSSYISRYFYNYEKVDNSAQNIKQGDESFGRYNHYFEDDLIKINLDCTPYEIAFYLHNKTEVPIKIIWDSVKVNSEYLKNEPLEIYHTNKSQDNLANKIQPSIILAKKNWMDEIVFNKNIYLLPYELNNKDSLMKKSNSVIGKKIKLILPLEINGKIKDYTFIFSVKDFSVLSKG